MRTADYATSAQIRAWSELDPQAPLFESLVLFETHEITEHLRRQGPEWRHRSFQYLRSPRVPLSVYGYIEQQLQLKIIFDPALFDPASMWRLLGHLQNVMEAMPAGAERPVAELPWLSAAERHQLLVDWNDTAGDAAWQPVHRRFEEQARHHPQALAVAGTGGSRTYVWPGCWRRAGSVPAPSSRCCSSARSTRWRCCWRSSRREPPISRWRARPWSGWTRSWRTPERRCW